MEETEREEVENETGKRRAEETTGREGSTGKRKGKLRKRGQGTKQMLGSRGRRVG